MGFGSDGASVNCGKKEGVIKTLLQESNEWLVFGWCVAHRLELSLKDSLSERLFYCCRWHDIIFVLSVQKVTTEIKTAKKIVSLYESTEFHEGGFRPRKASGISYNHPNFFLNFLFRMLLWSLMYPGILLGLGYLAIR